MDIQNRDRRTNARGPIQVVIELRHEAFCLMPGTLLLLGFQLALMLGGHLRQLGKVAHGVYHDSVICLTLTVLLLVAVITITAPVRSGWLFEQPTRIAHGALMAARAGLVLALAGDFFVAANRVSGSPGLGIVVALIVVGLAAWF